MLLNTRLSTRFATAFSAAVAAFGLASSASAQGSCFVPDQLDAAPCCTPVDLNAPQLIPGGMQASGFCWSACGLTAQTCLRVQWDPFVFSPQCGHYETPLTVLDCAGQPLMKGMLNLDYTRTWNETTVAGAVDLQVWRYAAKVDFGLASTTALGTCPVPPDLGVHPTTFFYGYFDLARNCITGTQENALVLFHNCDTFIHDPTLSSRPGSFHPGETFAIVAPDSPANPFVPVSTPLGSGPVLAEAMRTTTLSPVFGACLAEEPVLQGGLAQIGFGCLCPLSLTTAMNTASTLFGAGACGGSFASLNLWPIAPWFDFNTTSIGSWTTAATYPGPERAHVAEGLFLYRDACSATGAIQQSLDVFYGSVTEGGYPVIGTSPVGLFTDRLVDLASNYSAALPGPVTFPLVGEVKGTDHLIYVNY